MITGIVVGKNVVQLNNSIPIGVQSSKSVFDGTNTSLTQWTLTAAMSASSQSVQLGHTNKRTQAKEEAHPQMVQKFIVVNASVSVGVKIGAERVQLLQVLENICVKRFPVN